MLLRSCFRAWTLLLVFLHVAACAASLLQNDGDGEDASTRSLKLTEDMIKSHGTAVRLSNQLNMNELEETTLEDFTYFQSFRVEPNAVLVAKPTGQDYCFVVFRGTVFHSVRDWLPNVFPMGSEQICHNGDGSQNSQCCRVRKAYTNSYKAPFRSQMEASIRECAATCTNKDECVLFTGISQGGALATTAAIYLADLNPRVVTLGAPLTVYPNCEIANSTRWFRYIHTRVVTSWNGKPWRLVYDPLPTLPGNSPVAFLPGQHAEHRGHLMIVSPEKPMGVAYIGLDSQQEFRPVDPTLLAHLMGHRETFAGIVHSYDEKYGGAKSHYNISITGFQDGSLCSVDAECASQDCSKSRLFEPKRCQANSNR